MDPAGRMSINQAHSSAKDVVKRREFLSFDKEVRNYGVL
jgi:hypothetical protein